ncbi:ribonuclease P protein component [Candidatus Saccharibacteria bacterium]|nr:ribonuclease P protein component [Candidatus Saccharibacteria bacterium]
MLQQRYRFHGYGGLRYLYRHASAERSRLLTVKYVANRRRRMPRIAVVVSKKVHKSAVGRNRIRRRVYEILRQHVPYFTGVYDVALIITSSEVLATPHDDLALVVKNLLVRAGICPGDATPSDERDKAE